MTRNLRELVWWLLAITAAALYPTVLVWGLTGTWPW